MAKVKGWAIAVSTTRFDEAIYYVDLAIVSPCCGEKLRSPRGHDDSLPYECSKCRGALRELRRSSSIGIQTRRPVPEGFSEAPAVEALAAWYEQVSGLDPLSAHLASAELIELAFSFAAQQSTNSSQARYTRAVLPNPRV